MNTGKVIQEHKTNYAIRSDEGDIHAVVRGSFHAAPHSYPKVGDVVRYTLTAPGQAVIEEVAERTSVIARKRAGADEVQVIVANVNLIVIVMGLDQDFNLNRLERYLLLAEQSSITPLIVLNKADLVDDLEARAALVQERFPQSTIITTSGKTGSGIEALRAHLTPGVVAVLLGSSGAGKSTLTNQLLHTQQQLTRDVRADDSHGRHTTTARELFTLPSGGELIDTPGMRELGLVEDVGDSAQYADIEHIATQCRFADCDHEKSTGCAIQHALQEGTLDEARFRNYIKLQKEHEYARLRQDEEHERLYRAKERALNKKYRKVMQGKRREQEEW